MNTRTETTAHTHTQKHITANRLATNTTNDLTKQTPERNRGARATNETDLDLEPPRALRARPAHKSDDDDDSDDDNHVKPINIDF